MSTAVHKTTFQVIEDANTPEYASNDWLINPDLSRVRDVDKKYWYLKDGELHQMDNELKRKLDDADLAGVKQQSCKAIDDQTDSILSKGFEYPAMSGKHMILSNKDRLMLQGIIVLSMESVQYPIFIQYVDGSNCKLLSKSDVSSLAQSDVAHYLQIKKAGDEAKTKIMEALSADKVREVVANRSS